MIAMLIRWSIANRFLVLLATMMLTFWGVWSLLRTPLPRKFSTAYAFPTPRSRPSPSQTSRQPTCSRRIKLTASATV